MRRFTLTAALLLITAVPTAAQTTAYLRNPDLAVGYVDSCAAFWLTAYDPAAGGYWTNVDRTGKLLAAWGTNKNTLNQSRDAYGFTRAFMLTGNEAYLTAARRALDFLYAHSWDRTHGGVYAELDRMGNPTHPTADKSAYEQHYATVGPAAFAEATGDTAAWRWLNQVTAYEDAKLWDSTPGRDGYFDHVRADGSAPDGKSFNATVDALTTHTLALYDLTGDERYRQRAVQLGANILDHLTPTLDQNAIGFAEQYSADWRPDGSQTMTIMGHVLKTAWCLGRLQGIAPNSAYLPAAEKLVDDVWTRGYDHRLGGPYKDYNRTSGQMLMWGQRDTAKAWWQMEQAITSGLVLHHLTGEPRFLQMADETLAFYMRYFVDHTYGEVYENRTRDGRQIWDVNKGSSGKAAYHSTETGYYIYLYGHLLLRGEPATLHYRYEPLPVARTIRLTPIDDADLRITAVLLDGQPYLAFDGAARTLSLPAGFGGHFTVTYAPTAPTAVADSAPTTPDGFRLDPAAPNPFNPTTTLGYQLSTGSHVKLEIFDALGRRIRTLVDEPKPAGQYTATFDASGLPSGLYLARLTVAGRSRSQRLTLLR